MTNLEEFWANNNTVEDFKEVKKKTSDSNLVMPPSSAQGVQVDPQLLTADCLPGTQSYSGK